MNRFFIDNSWQIVINILGGLLTVALIDFVKWILHRLHNLKFKSVFASINFLVYGELALSKRVIQFLEKNNEIELAKFPFEKRGRENINFSAQYLVSSCETRAVNYLTSGVSQNINKQLDLVADSQLKDILDVSFISIGGMSNIKTADVLNNSENDFIDFDLDTMKFVSKQNKKEINLPYGENVDFGLILKIHPKQFPNNTWIACFGFGEWGTSGAAWYLSKKWQDIYKIAKDKKFAYFIKVNLEQDESAEPVFRILNKKDLEMATT